MQVNFKKSTMSEHVTHLETLREEINIMTEKKMDLERRIEVRQTPSMWLQEGGGGGWQSRDEKYKNQGRDEKYSSRAGMISTVAG